MNPFNWLDHCWIAVKSNRVLVNHVHGERKSADESDRPNHTTILMNLLVDNVPWNTYSTMISKSSTSILEVLLLLQTFETQCIHRQT